MARKTFLIFPAFNSVLQWFAGIFRIKVSDIGVVFKLAVNGCSAFFLILLYLKVSFNGLLIRFSRIGFQPFLKRDQEGEAAFLAFWKQQKFLLCPESARSGQSAPVFRLTLVCCSDGRTRLTFYRRHHIVSSLLYSVKPHVFSMFREAEPSGSVSAVTCCTPS